MKDTDASMLATVVVDGVAFDCPFCGLPVAIGYGVDGEPCVAHVAPYCLEFTLDALEFTLAARAELERKAKAS